MKFVRGDNNRFFSIKNTRSFALAFSLSLFIFLGTTLNIFAAPPTTKYAPGDTLDPNCAPGSTNCTVDISTGSFTITLAGTSGSSQTLNDGDTITIASGVGITTTAGATDTVTVAFDFSSALSGNHTLSSNESKFGQSGIIFEGATADGIESYFLITDPTSSDRTFTFPDRSGTVSLSGDTFTGDVTGTLDSSGSTGLTISADSVALGTDTTGNYVATIADAGSGLITVNNSGTENAAVTLSIVNDSIGDTQLQYNTGQNLTSTSAVTFATIDTGQGANELYDMDQNVLTTSSVTFSGLTLSSLAGGGTQCLQVNNSGVISGTGAGCGTSTGISSLTLAGTSGSNQTLNDGDTITIGAGNGISTTGSATDTVTVALSALTGDWNQTGAFDISLNNASSELKILESAGATYFGIFDVADLTSDRTVTVPDRDGTIILSGDTFTGDVTGTLDSTGATALTISIDSVDLGTDTVGDYVSGATSLGGLVSTSAEGGTLGFDFSTALSGNVALSANAMIFGQSGLIFEGSVSDNFETFIAITNPTADRTITFPNTTGTVITTGNITDITGLTDSQVSDTLTASIFINGGSVTNSVDLGTSEVAGTLPIANGGTGATTLNDLITLGTHTTGNYVATIADAGSGLITVNNSGTENAAVTLSIVNDSIGDTQLQYNTGQNLTSTSAVTFATIDTGQGANELYDMDQNVLTTSSVTFSGLTLSSLAGGGTQCLQVNNSGVISATGSACGSAGVPDADYGDIVVSSSGTVWSVDTDSVALGTDTLGDYVSGATSLGGLVSTSAEGGTLGFDFSTALSGNVSLSANAMIFGQSGLIFEGSASDTFETFFAVTNPTSDRTLTFPNLSGTVILSGHTFTGDVTATLGASNTTALAIAADIIDWADIADATTLDASTSISFGANSLTFTNNGASNMVVNLTSTGDFLIQDNGARLVDFRDDGVILFEPSGGVQFGVGPSTGVLVAASHPGLVDLFTVTNSGQDTNTNGVDGLSLSFAASGFGGDTNYGLNISGTSNAPDVGDLFASANMLLTNSSTNGTQYVLSLRNANSTGVTEAGLFIDNADTTASSMADGILITSSGVNDGITDAIDVSAANITNAINIGANSIAGTNFSVTGAGVITAVGASMTRDSASTYVATFFNDGNNDNRWGISIQAGADTPNANRWIQFNDGDGTDQGSVCYTGGQANICAPSDVRLKDNIVDTTYGINDLLKIKVRDYVYKSDESRKVVRGFIAQELYEAYPDAVSVPTDQNEMWRVSYNQLTPLIVRSIQDLNIKIEPLRSIDTNNPNSLGSLVKNFLADASNGLEKLFVKEIYVQKICVGSTCVDEQTLNSLMQNHINNSQVQTIDNTVNTGESVEQVINDLEQSAQESSEPLDGVVVDETQNVEVEPEIVQQD